MQTISQRIDELMEGASVALVQRRYFQCERLAVEALRAAHADRDYARMARILMPLQEARRHKTQMALDAASVQPAPVGAAGGAGGAGGRKKQGANGAAGPVAGRPPTHPVPAPGGGGVTAAAEEPAPVPLWGIGGVYLIDGGYPTPGELRAGCYLVQPPRVGLDGRVLRQTLDEVEVPALVVVREPTTRAGQWPLVALGPVTVRLRVPPPSGLLAIPGRHPPVAPPPAPTGSARSGAKRGSKAGGSGATPDEVPATKPGPMHPEGLPPAAWFVEAINRLGDAAIEQVDPGRNAHARVDELVLRLETVPAHEGLHQRLRETCLEAAACPAPAGRAARDELDAEADGDDED